MSDVIKLIDEKLEIAKTQKHLAKQNNYATKIKTAGDQIELLETLKKEIGDLKSPEPKTSSKKSSKTKTKKED